MAFFLKGTDTWGNDLYGTLPRELSLLTDLKRFLAPHNSIKGNLDDPFHGLVMLDTLVINNNELSGTLPLAVLERNKNLGTPESGSVHPFSYHFAAYRLLCCSCLPGVLSIGTNDMTGTIPSILGASKLSQLSVLENRFTGTM